MSGRKRSSAPLSGPADGEFALAVLDWYDRHARSLPWRQRDGAPDPYRVWLSEIMLQQTTVAAVTRYFARFTDLWPTVHDLAAAEPAAIMREWAGLGYYARARNLHKCAQIIASEHGGVFPDEVADLIRLPGVGEYTAAAIAAIAFNKPETAVDGNVERIMARFHRIDTPLPAAKRELRSLAAHYIPGQRCDRTGDYTQALMDIGATICTPTLPKCEICPLGQHCMARNSGTDPATLPRREKKSPRPRRVGYVYWVTDKAGRVLIHTRPETGLLGGMRALPTSAWESIAPDHPPWIQAALLVATRVEVRHIFTHFELHLSGLAAPSDSISIPDLPDKSFQWVARDHILAEGLPSLFRKAAMQFLGS